MKKHLQILLLLAAMMCSIGNVRAQELTEYTYSTGIDSSLWINVPTSLSSLITPGAGDYGVSTVQNLGFTFPFGEDSHTQFSVNSDGNLKLGSVVTGTSYYSTPFSSSSANYNNPKINFLGCDGFCGSSNYVRYLHTADTNGDSLGVVEFCMGTYTSSTRSYLYKWQVHLYHNGNIKVVIGPTPTAGPGTTFQYGMCTSSADGFIFNSSYNAVPFTNGSSTTLSSGFWPAEGRYYQLVRPTVNCPRPLSVSVSNLTANSVHLSWVPADPTVSQYNIHITSQHDSLLTGTDITVYDDTATVTGLMPGTDYTFGVQALCDAGDSSTFRQTMVTTPCLAIEHDSLPYFEDFEDWNPIDPCWRKGYLGVSSTYPSISTAYAASGTHSLYFYGYSSSYYCYAVMPGFADSLNTLMVSFKLLKTSTSYGSIEVGVMDNPDDISTFHSITTVSPTATGRWEDFTVSLMNYPGTGFIAFRQAATYYTYLDDVKVENLPTCAPVSQLAVSNITGSSAFLNWSYLAGVAPNVPQQYEVTVSDTNGFTITNTDTLTYFMVSGLSPSSTYTAHVRSECDGGDYGVSDSIVFTTAACAAGGNIELSSATLGLSSATTYDNPTNGCYEYSYTQQIYESSLLSGVSSINGIAFKLSVTTSDTRDWDVYLGETTNTAFSSTTAIPLSTLTKMDDASFSTSSTGWVSINFDSSYVYNGGNLVVAIDDNTGSYNCSPEFACHITSGSTCVTYYQDGTDILPSAPSGYDGDEYITNYRPDIIFLTPCDSTSTCFAPNVVAAGVGSDHVDLVWAAGGTETSWDMDYKAVGDSVWSSTTTLTGSSYTLTGLLPYTAYQIRFSPICADTVLYTTVMVQTICAPFSFPINENFEGWDTYTTSGCWSKLSSYATNYPYISTSYSYGGGNKSMYMYASGGTYSALILPELASPVDSAELVFYLMRTNTSYPHDVRVGVMTDPADFSTFVAVDTVTPGATYEWTPAAVTFGRYTGTGRHIAIVSGMMGNYSYPYLDLVSVERLSSCRRPDSTSVSSITGRTATLHWAGSADEYEVEYGLAGFTRGSGTFITSVTDDSLALTGLAPSSQYQFYVRGICPDDTSNWSFATAFYTECGLIDTLPFFENFNNIGTSTSVHAPQCWTGTSSYSTSYPYPSSSYSRSGGGASMYMYHYNNGSNYTILQLPQVDTTALPMNSLQVEFSMLCNTTSYTHGVIVGVCTAPGMVGFVPVDTLMVTAPIYNWQDYEVPLNNYNGNGTYITFKAYSGTSNYCYPYLDDILLTTIPTCIRPDEVYASVVTTTDATIRWRLRDTLQTDFEIRVGPSGCNPDTLTGIFVSGIDSLLLTGLDSGTYYDVYIRSICGPDDTSRWTSGSFRTLVCAPISVYPYRCGFGTSEALNWTLENGSQTNAWYVGQATYNPANADSMSLYISNSQGSANTYSTGATSHTYAYRTFNMAAGEYAYSFDWKCQGESRNYDFIRAFVMPASEVLTAGSVLGGSTYSFATTPAPTGWFDISGVTSSPYTLAQNGSTWTTVAGSFNIAEAGTYKVVFVWSNDASGGTQPPAGIDNVFVKPNTCPAVTNVAANCSADSIQLSWTPGGTETSWEVTYGNTTVVVTDSNYTATGLTPDSLYNFFITAICDATDSAFATVASLRTTCYPVTLPYFINFDSVIGTTSYSSGVFPACWNYELTVPSYQSVSYKPFVYNNSTYAHSGSNSLRLYGAGYHVLPPVSAPLDSLQMDFWDYSTSTYYGLEVGVMEGNNFVPVQVIPSTSSVHAHYTIYFGSYTGNSRIIAFHNYYTTSTTVGYSYHYIDDITVDYLPSCPPVLNINSVGASESSIDVDWTDQVTAASWEIEYGLAGFTFGQGTRVTTTSHPYTVTGLDTLTSYDFYVRPICSATDTGIWQDPATLQTTYCNDAQVTAIGSSSSSSTQYLYPLNNFYRYTLTETIIDSAELNGAQDISAISYYYAYSAPMTAKTNVDIYLQPTRLSTFSSTSAIVALDTAIAVRVYHGALNCSEGWNTFVFDTTFSYDGTGNLLVIVDDNSYSYNSSTYVFKSDACTGNKTIYYYSDSYDPNVLSPTPYSGTTGVVSSRAVMKLTSCNAVSCHVPVVTNTSVTYGTATINWTGDGADYEVAVKQTVASTWPTETSVTGNTYTFTGLQPATEYTARVRQDCTLDTLGYSEWREVQFTTDSLPCFAPDSLTATVLDNANAIFTWQRHAGTSETAWNLHAWDGIDLDTLITVTGGVPTTTLGCFTAGATYSAAVRALCGTDEDIEGDYGDTIQFTMATCPDVTNAISTGHTFNSVTLDWNSTAPATSWIIEYGPYGFSQGNGTLVTATAHPYTVTGLSDDQTYDFYVRAVCGTNWQSEHWSSQIRVTTDEAPEDTYTVTAVSNNPQWGSVNGGGTYAANATVTLTAIPTSGYEFVEWDDHNTANPRTFTVTCDTSFTATFAAIPSYTITVMANNDEWGTVAGGGTFQRGTEIQISATANEGYHFDRWNDGSTDNPHTVTVMADVTYTANFVSDSAAMFTVTLTVNDEAMGTVVGAGTYPEGSVVTIAALPNSGFHFVNWSDGNTEAARDLTITADVELMATFEQNVGIDEVNGATTCTIYPNPAGNAATISVSGVNGLVRIALLDMSGRTVASETLECSGDCEKRMDVENLVQGTYFVRITGEQVNLVKKLIVR